MRTWLLVSFLATASCSAFVKANPEYCDSSDQCPTGSACDPQLHRCGSGSSALALTAVEPPVGVASGGTPIILRGRNFRAGMIVLVNGTPTGATVISPSGDSASTVAPFSNGTCGPVNVQVVNPGGEQAESAALFRYKLGNIDFIINDTAVLDVMLPTISLTTGDTRGIGWNDLIALNSSGTQTSLRVLLTQPDGKAGGSTNTATSNTYSQVMAANLNNDPYPDLLSVAMTGTGVWVGGAGSQFVQNQILSMSAKTAGTIDLNQDGLVDLILAGGANLSVYRNTSTAGALSFMLVSGTQPQVKSNYLAADYFDSDRIGDVALVDSTGQLAVSFGDGNLNFATTLSVPSGVSNPGFLAAADVDQDGLRDLILVDPQSRMISVVRNLGNRTFAVPLTVALSGVPDLVQVADLDCDGLPEVIYAQRGTRVLYVQRNLGAAPYFDTVQTATVTSRDNIALFTAARLDQDRLVDLGVIGTAGLQNMAYLVRNSSQ